MGYPSESGLVEVAMRTTFEKYPDVSRIASGPDVLAMRKLVRQVPVASHVEDLAMRLVRATPKTQAALLEAMEEHTVTVGGATSRLAEPFFILATQNPI